MNKFFRIDLSKNVKLFFYIKHIAILFTPKIFFSLQRKKLLEEAEKDTSLQTRVNYYNKTTSFQLPAEAKSYSQFLQEKKKTYFFDLLAFLKYFPSSFRFYYVFGDVVTIPKAPAFVKSRPIGNDNANAVLFKLNKIRHFIFVNDTLAFEEKKDMVVWRGKCYKAHRQEFVQKFYNHPLCDIGQTNTKGNTNVPWQKGKLSLKQQLEYKFILAIEGNDVASNLKWAMSSSSLVFMTKPKYETWFMEGTLKAGYHYAQLKDDYSDLEEKVNYYKEHTEEAKEIIHHANLYTKEFQNLYKEKLISLLVMQKYYENTQN